ncbi:unnamed protein product [Enterobius vermicularis]|uniref:Claudin-6 n=1 Tax=Enterobius vermicularis TaxID=51028 RepID=A0A0N4VF93_ENTVE|nr:unnamed protein product [Enterobius vermicularis]
MCCSFLGQVLYGAIMLGTLGLTLGAMFSSGWSEIKSDFNNDIITGIPHPKTLFAFVCGSDDVDAKACKEYFDSLQTWMKAVIVLMCLSAVAEVIALIWTIFTIFACCCKKYVVHPLPAVALLLAILLAAALIIFGINSGEGIVGGSGYKSELGYSFYMACASLLGAIIDIVVGALTAALAQKDL